MPTATPPHPESLFQQAVRQHQAGAWQEAEPLYRALLSQWPDHPDANHNLGILLLNTGQPAEALPHLRRAAASDPKRPAYGQSLIAALLENHLPDQADQELAWARQLGWQGATMEALARRLERLVPPARAEGRELIALFTQGQFEEAEQRARAMIARHAGEGLGWKVLGVLLQRRGCLEEASTAMERAVTLLPHDAEARINLAIVTNQLGQPGRAEALCREALALKPDWAAAHNMLGVALWALGRLQEAEGHCRRAVELQGNMSDAHVNLGLILLDLGRLDEAELSTQHALALHPDSVAARNNLGNICKARGQRTEARSHYQRILARDSGHAEAHLNLGVLAMEQGLWHDAEGYCRQALALRPDFPEALIDLGVVLREQYRLNEAAECARRAVQCAPESSTAHLNLGAILKECEAYAEAEAHLNRALELQPGHVDALNNLGCVLQETGRFPEAEAHFRQTVTLAPNRATLWIHLGAVLLPLGRTREAWECLEQALALLTASPPDPEAHPPLRSDPVMDPHAAIVALLEARSRLHSAGIPFFLALGTLLGIVRQGSLLPYDKDLDIGLPWEVDRAAVVHALCDGAAFRLHHARRRPGLEGRLHIPVRHHNGIVLDLFFYRPDGEHFQCGLDYDPHPILSRPRRFAIGSWSWQGVEWPVPMPPEAYLTDFYGTHWATPDPNFDTVLSSHCQLPESRESRLLFGWLRLLQRIQNREWSKALGCIDQLLRLQGDPRLHPLSTWIRTHRGTHGND